METVKYCVECNNVYSSKKASGPLCPRCRVFLYQTDIDIHKFRVLSDEDKTDFKENINKYITINDIKSNSKTELKEKDVFSINTDLYNRIANTIEEKEQEEQGRKNFALESNGLYEYDVITIINDKGHVDKNQMIKVLTEKANDGWRLHTMYSNELGKNALSIMGFGLNETKCEDVMIFERRLKLEK